MKSALLALSLTTVCGFFAQANSACEITASAKARFSNIEIVGCGANLCVETASHGGVRKSERLIAKGCGGSYCYLESPSFTYVIPAHDEVSQTRYLGNSSGKEIYLICN